MIVDPDLLARYLRQRRDLGEREVFFDELTAAEVLAAIRTIAAGGQLPAGLRAPAEQAASVGAAATGAAEASAGVRSVGEAVSEARLASVESTVAMPPEAPLDSSGDAAGALRVLAAEAAGCTLCRLHAGRTTVVFGEGNPQAEVVVVGEAPGFEEDRTGRPFVGAAGKLLDLMLLSIGLPRESVYICNVLKCRPPNNRDPQRDEVEACTGYLRRQLDLIAPRALLAVGKFAAQTLTGSDASIGRLRGRVHEYMGVPVIATYHPAFLLRSPQWTRAAWQDLQFLREVLDGAAR